MTFQRVRGSAVAVDDGTVVDVATGSASAESISDQRRPVWLTEFEFETNLYDQAGMLNVTGQTDQLPTKDQKLTLSVMGTTVGTGTINTVKPVDGVLTEVQAIDSVKKLKRETISRNFSENRAIEVIADVCDAAGVEVFQSGSVVTTPPEEQPTAPPIPYNEETAWSIIDSLCEKINWIYYIDEYDRLVLATSDDIKPESPQSISREVVELLDVIEADPALREPPYDGVIVKGGSKIPTTDGKLGPGSHQLSTQRVVGYAGSTSDGDRVFIHPDPTIREEEFAEKAAKGIYEELLRSRVGGKIEIPGDPTLRVFDGVKMPSWLGGAKYLVSSLTHKFDHPSGYTTEIEPGGLISATAEIPTRSETRQGADTGTDTTQTAEETAGGQT